MEIMPREFPQVVVRRGRQVLVEQSPSLDGPVVGPELAGVFDIPDVLLSRSTRSLIAYFSIQSRGRLSGPVPAISPAAEVAKRTIVGAHRAVASGITAAQPPDTLGTPHSARQDRPARQPALEVFGHRPSRSVTTLRFFLQAFQADRFKVTIDRLADRAGGLADFLHDLLQRIQRCHSTEWWAAGQDRVQDCPQPVYVGRSGHRSPSSRGLFGRHVRGCPEHGPGLGQFAIPFDTPGQPEVGHQRLASFVDQNIGRFQVAVKDSALVGMVDGPRDDRHQSSRRPGVAMIFLEPFREVSPFDKLHAEKAATALFGDLVNRHDIGMVEMGDCLGLVAKPSRIVVAGPGSVANHLECHQTVQAALTSPKHHAHAAPRDHALQFVVAESQTRRGGRDVETTCQKSRSIGFRSD